MKLILVILIRIVVIFVSLCILGVSMAYIVYPKYTGIEYNYAPSLYGRILGVSILLIISILGVFPYKLIRKEVVKNIFLILLILISLIFVYIFGYYFIAGEAVPMLYLIPALIYFANLWAFLAISKTNELK